MKIQCIYDYTVTGIDFLRLRKQPFDKKVSFYNDVWYSNIAYQVSYMRYWLFVLTKRRDYFSKLVYKIILMVDVLLEISIKAILK